MDMLAGNLLLYLPDCSMQRWGRRWGGRGWVEAGKQTVFLTTIYQFSFMLPHSTIASFSIGLWLDVYSTDQWGKDQHATIQF